MGGLIKVIQLKKGDVKILELLLTAPDTHIRSYMDLRPWTLDYCSGEEHDGTSVYMDIVLKSGEIIDTYRTDVYHNKKLNKYEYNCGRSIGELIADGDLDNNDIARIVMKRNYSNSFEKTQVLENFIIEVGEEKEVSYEEWR